MSIIFNHVYHSYDADTQLKTDALSDISFKIDDGEFIGLIGHTGSGKSTLVQHMNGLVKPSQGEVYFDGKDICVHNKFKKSIKIILFRRLIFINFGSNLPKIIVFRIPIRPIMGKFVW